MSKCIENQGIRLSLEYIGLSKCHDVRNLKHVYSSAWGVYCAAIRHCRVNSLTLFVEMKK